MYMYIVHLHVHVYTRSCMHLSNGDFESTNNIVWLPLVNCSRSSIVNWNKVRLVPEQNVNRYIYMYNYV